MAHKKGATLLETYKIGDDLRRDAADYEAIQSLSKMPLQSATRTIFQTEPPPPPFIREPTL